MFDTLTVFAEGENTASGTTASGTAQTADGGVGAAQSAGSMISAFLPMIIVIVLLYVMMIRPQKKREKETQEMQDALRIGDKIVTIGGIAGKIAKIKDEYIYVETGMPGKPERTYIKMERSSIKEVVKKAEEKKSARLAAEDIGADEEESE